MATFLKRLLGIGEPCLFHVLTGLYCPGCGGSRAVVCLLQGDWKMSFQYHPLVLYTAAALALAGGSRILAKLLGRPKLCFKHCHALLLGAAAVVALNWAFKNYMLAVRGIDLLPLR